MTGKRDSSMTAKTAYKTLLEEYEATCGEMRKISVQCGDEVLYDDINGDNDIHVGMVIGTDYFPGNRDEPPSWFHTILKDDETEEVFEDEYVMKRKAIGKIVNVNGVMVPDLGKIKIIGASTETASVRYLDDYHFEMSDVHGEFGTVSAHIWATAEYEFFCHTYGIRIEAAGGN